MSFSFYSHESFNFVNILSCKNSNKALVVFNYVILAIWTDLNNLISSSLLTKIFIFTGHSNILEYFSSDICTYPNLLNQRMLHIVIISVFLLRL